MKYFLVIMDGWGHRTESLGNAVLNGNTPAYDQLKKECPHTFLATCGERVGLPAGVMGNSEVGHLNIGAGRVVYQDITFINKSLRDGDFFTNSALNDAMEAGKDRVVHLMGLLSDGGVHSHEDHLYALLKLARKKGVSQVYIHALMDGRDTPPHSGIQYMRKLLDVIDEIGIGRVASVCGRYYAMDRDNRWDRVEKAYSSLVYGQGATAPDPVSAIQQSYDQGVTDEFILPTIIETDEETSATMRDGDSFIFFNFRADRTREITRALNDEDFDGFNRKERPRLHFTTFTQYDATFSYPVCFPPRRLERILADVFARNQISNLRMAETEKYAHVTFFFNGGVEEPFPGERRVLIPSPKVATYDLQPEMSAVQLTDRLLAEVDSGTEDVYIVNFANGDMVGHTGVYEAAVRAVETVNKCMARIVKKVRETESCLLVTADHGNSEMEIDPVSGGPHTAHTLNDVPFIVYHPSRQLRLKHGGALENIAPTLLDLMGISQPSEMTGDSLIES